MLSVLGDYPTRLVAKTVATAKSVRSFGLTAAMVEMIHCKAYEKGYESVIHALMYEENDSRFTERLFGTERFRRYALYVSYPE